MNNQIQQTQQTQQTQLTQLTQLTKWQSFIAYMGGSIFQITLDNPITSYRQLIQQYAKDLNGNMVHPKIAVTEANKVFMKSPISASLSGIMPRLLGASSKSAPKFGFFLGNYCINWTKRTKYGISYWCKYIFSVLY